VRFTRIALVSVGYVLYAHAAHAEEREHDRAGFVYGMHAGVDVLMAGPEDSAAPLFYGLDQWTAVGLKLGVRVGWGFGEHFRLSVEPTFAGLTASDVAYAYAYTPSTGDVIDLVDLKITSLGISIAADWIHSSGLRLGFAQGLGVLSARMESDREYMFPETIPSFVLLGRAGFEVVLGRGFALALEAAAGLNSGMPEFSALVVGAWM
jgi:hypothetical protein